MPAARRDDLLVVAAALAPLALFLAREQQLAGALGFPLDDSWIHLHFARNLAEGAGFAYNPGRPVAGSTAPLWTLLLAGAAAVVGPSVGAAKAVGIACGVGAGLITRRAALALGAPAPLALLAAAGLLWTGPMAWGALSGMEVTLAALLVAAALLAHARDRPVWSASWAALAVLARPEAWLLVPCLALARPLGARRLALFGAVTAAALLPAALFSLWTAGAPYPATAAAKVEGGLLGWWGGLSEPLALSLLARPWRYLVEWIVWLARTQWALPLALAPGIVLAWSWGGRRLGAVALVLLAHPLGMALLAPYRGPAFQEGRYSIHLLPVAFVVLATVVAGAARSARAVGARRQMRRGSDTPGQVLRGADIRGPRDNSPRSNRLAVLATAAYLVSAAVMLAPAATRYGWAVQNINAMQVHLGRWLDGHAPPQARLAVNDIGAIAYFSRREIVDLMGLVTPEILPYRRRGAGGIAQYLLETCPDHVVIFPAWFPGLAARTDLLQPVYRVRLERNEVAGAREMVVYRLRRCAV